MSDNTNGQDMAEWPGPIQFIGGFVIWFLGFLLAALGAVFRAFPITAPIGSPLLKSGSGICYNGGHNMGQGLVRSVRSLGGLFAKGINRLRRTPIETPTDQLFPPQGRN